MNEPYITAYETGENISLEGKAFRLEGDQLIVQCMVWHTIAIPLGDAVEPFSLGNDYEALRTMSSSLSNAGG